MISFYITIQLYEKIIGFGKAETKGEDDSIPPAMGHIIDKMMEQDSKYCSVFLFILVKASDISSSSIFMALPFKLITYRII